MADVDLQGCELCRATHSIEDMSLHDDCWICEACDAEFKKEFAACAHEWKPHTDSMGDQGRYCSRCCGFVADPSPEQ